MEISPWKRVMGLDGCVRNRLWVAWCTGEGDRERGREGERRERRETVGRRASCLLHSCVLLYEYVCVHLCVCLCVCACICVLLCRLLVGGVGGERERAREREGVSDRKRHIHTHTHTDKNHSHAHKHTPARAARSSLPLPLPLPPPSTPIHRERGYFPPSILHRNGARL